MNKSRLANKLLIRLTPLVVIPLLLLIGMLINNASHSREAQSVQLSKNHIDKVRSSVDSYFSTINYFLEILSESPYIKTALKTPVSSPHYADVVTDTVSVFKQYADQFSDIYSIELLSSDGELLVFYSKDIYFDSYTNMLYPDLQTMVSDKGLFLKGKTEESDHYYFVQRLIPPDDASNENTPFLVFDIHSNRIQRFMDDTLNQFGFNALLSANGRILFSSNQELTDIHLSATEKAMIEKALFTGSPIRTSMLFDYTEDMLLRVEPLLNGKYLLTGYENAHIVEIGWQIKTLPLVISILCLCIFPLAIYLVLRNLMVNPIQKLSEASYSVGSGEFNIEVSTDSDDEFGQLFHDFNRMAQQLNESNIKLLDFQHHLAEKVEERTTELRTTNTKLERAIKTAEEANNLKSRFLANMSHEIRTPLTAIKGFTEHSMEDQLDVDQRNEYLNKVLNSSQHLEVLINNILDLSKIESEKIELEKVEFSIFQMIHDIESLLKPAADKKNLPLNIRFNLPLPLQTVSDETRIKQILLNIGSNAIKFTHQGSVTLSVSFQQPRQLFIIEYQDTGIGMSIEEQHRIFNPFEQADTSTTRRFGGTGLGLCISKNLATLLGGDIYLISEKGIGSTFTFSFPCLLPASERELTQTIPEHHQESPLNRLVEPLPELSDAKILLAEDNKDNQKLISLMLDRLDANLTIVNNGLEAVEAALVEDFDLILMDMQMPEMGGMEATHILRQTGNEVPIAALTANVMKEDIEEYLKAGCNTTIAKPIDRDQLFREIQGLLKPQQDTSIEKLFDNDPDFQDDLKELTKNFLNGLDSHLNKLEHAINQQAWDSVKAEAHSLKGSAGCFGYHDITQLAANLESSAKQQNAEAIIKAWRQLNDHCIQELKKRDIND